MTEQNPASCCEMSVKFVFSFYRFFNFVSLKCSFSGYFIIIVLIFFFFGCYISAAISASQLDMAPTLHIAMYPWLALGHLTAFIHLANKLAGKGNKISFIIPTKTKPKLEHFNLHPDLITLIPITIPHVQGLPPGAETTSDVPLPLHSHIMTAMDNTEHDIELLFGDLKPDIVFFDFTHWMPSLARRLGIKSLYYCCVSPATIGYTTSPARMEENEPDMKQPPQGYPVSSINLHDHEARAFAARRTMKFGSNTLFYDRLFTSLSQCDVIAFRSCRETEGPFIDYLETQFGKLVLPSGPVIPVSPTSSLEEKWANWLGGFKPGSVIYCAFGSECTLNKDRFQELLLGFELTGMPFFAALKPPTGAETIEAALPEGFENRIEGRGIVHGGWVQQQLILEHPSVGCFVTHCGSGSLSEAMVNKCQLVLLPQVADQIINARMMSRNLKVGVEVEKGEEDGLFSKQRVCDAVRSVMEEDSEVGREVRENHGRLRELLLRNDLESSYIDAFNQKLHDILE